MHAFLEKYRYFRNDDRYRHKPNTCPAYGRHACACKISLSYDAASRRR